MDHDEYLRQRDSLVGAYGSSIREFDRLVTWASAGALGLSISFLEKFGTDADQSTAWLLGLGWICLSSAFAMSLWSQYTSSRLHSWRRRELDHRQIAEAERPVNWAADTARFERFGRWYGVATRWMTFSSGVALVGGIMNIALFAFLNAPFKDTGGIQTSVAATEKKGLDHTPAPVPRPPSTTSTTTPPTPAESGNQKP